MANTQTLIHRGTGLLVLEVINSNPNGDPDRDGEPRTRANGIGEISPVSVKRKIRDLIEDKEGLVWENFASKMELDPAKFQILESSSTDPAQVKKLAKTPEGCKQLLSQYWDVRLFGTTYLQKDDGSNDKEGNRFIHSGLVQFGLGTSIAPVRIERMTNTRKANPEEDKTGGMAPMGYRIVEHGVYTIPFFVNPNDAKKLGTTEQDIELMLQLLPYAYKFTSSAARPHVEVRHVWYARHKNPLGSVNDVDLVQQLKPVFKKVDDSIKYSSSWADYEEAVAMPNQLSSGFSSKVDLMDYANNG
jgi:Cas7 group CRISPR-associated protein Csh2